MTQTVFSEPRRLFHRLLGQAKFVKDAGLLYGQMGIVVALAHCYKKTGEPLYEEFMDGLLDEAIEHLNVELPVDFGKGLSGIGWGIEFLLQNGLVTGNSLEICAEIDERIMCENVKHLTDLTLETGIEGRLHYLLAHLRGCMLQANGIPFCKDFLEDWWTVANRLEAESDTSPSLQALAGQYRRFYKEKEVPAYHFDLLQWVDLPTGNRDLLQCPPGLKEGLAGMLLTQNKG